MFEYTEDEAERMNRFCCPKCGSTVSDTVIEELYLNRCTIGFTCGDCDHEWISEYSINLIAHSPVV